MSCWILLRCSVDNTVLSLQINLEFTAKLSFNSSVKDSLITQYINQARNGLSKQPYRDFHVNLRARSSDWQWKDDLANFTEREVNLLIGQHFTRIQNSTTITTAYICLILMASVFYQCLLLLQPCFIFLEEVYCLNLGRSAWRGPRRQRS